MEILPVKQVKNNEKTTDVIPDPFMKPPFLGFVFGGVKSGKSCLLINIIYRVYSKKLFNGGIIVFSPNIYNDDIFDNNFASDDEIKKIDQDLHNIDMYVESIVKIQKETKKEDRKHILLIFDDILGFIKQNRFISNFCSRYRQVKISMIFTTQLFRGIPPIIRSNASFMILFRTYSAKEKIKIIEELSHIRDFEEMYDEATKKRYGFLFVDLKNLKLYDGFTRCLYDHDKSFDE